MPALSQFLAVTSTIWKENSGVDRVTYLFRGAVWQCRKRLGHSLVTRLANGSYLRVHPSTAYSAAFYTRWIERKDLLFIRAHADLAPTFVDVGANIGLFSASLFDKFSHFILIEPARDCVAALRETCALNPSIRSELVNVAISDRSGEALFLGEGNFSTTARIAQDRGTGELISVNVETLDKLLGEQPGNFVVKVDVEGHEESVFRGAESLLRAARIKLLMFERLGRTNVDNILKFFEMMDYVVFYVGEDAAITFDREAVRAPLINLFACPRSVLTQLASPQ
jgi:FkbM family methyltransferase